MSSSKGTSNTTKTAHVMNLLRKSNPAAQADAEAPAAPAPAEGKPPQTPPHQAPAPQVPPIITELNADAKISNQIKNALEDELSELAAESPQEMHTEAESVEAPTPVPPSPAQEAPSPVPAEPSAEDEAPAEEDTLPPAEPEEVQQPAADIPAESISAEPTPAPSAEEANAPAIFNIPMELTLEMVDKYMTMFDVCPCQRCRNDVIALTMNGLCAKYIVLRPSEYHILSDMFTNRYKSDVVAQLMHACSVVKEHPRHDS